MLRESVLGGRDLQTVLLESKTEIPRPTSSAVKRTRQIRRARDSGARVVSVAAPAGYGKSTMLTEWAATESRRVAWVSLDRTDDDPALLLPLIAAACAPFSPLADAVMADMRGVGAGALGRSAPMLAAALASTPVSFVLFIDDAHLVASEECQDALEVVLSRIAPGSQVVLASRQESPLIARLRSTGDAWDVSAADLVFDRVEARAVFAAAGAADVDDEALAEVVARCEGWPTGLFLCALVARSSAAPVTATGSDRYLADYLYRECLARLPEELQSFLRRSSVLDQLSPEICNAVLGIENARALIHRVETGNLFLVRADRNGDWFRFHALFREFLLAELERAEGATAVAELHRRAASWHEAHQAPILAVEHWISAGEYERASGLVAELGLGLYGTGQVATVRRWLHDLGDDILLAHPALVVSMTWTAILLGDVRAGERWASALDDIRVEDLPAADRLLFESARAMVRAAMCEHGYRRVGADAAFAFEHEPVKSPWRDQALHLYGMAALLAGDEQTARVAFEQAVPLATAMGNPDTVILSEPELALIAMDEGHWAVAAEHAQRGVDAIDASHMEGYPTTALALAVAARVALHGGDHAAGGRLLARGMRARIGCTHLMPYVSVRVRVQLARAHLMLGDRAAAAHLLRESDDIVRIRPDLGTAGAQVEELRVALSVEPMTGGSVPLTPAELRLLPYLQTHLTIAEIGKRLFVSRNTVSSQLGSIYRKLSATSRSQAVERADALGLLGD